jgi:hypothetical protein
LVGCRAGGRVAGIECGAAGEQLMCLGRTAVRHQRPEERVGVAEVVARSEAARAPAVEGVTSRGDHACGVPTDAAEHNRVAKRHGAGAVVEPSVRGAGGCR